MIAPLRTRLRATSARWSAVVLVAACLSHADRFFAGSPVDPKAKPPEAKKVELHRLTNEELLKQAAAIFDKASWDYLAQMRALASTEALLEEAREQAEALKPAPAAPDKPPAMEVSGEEAARKAVEAAKAKQDLAKRKLKLAGAQKELLDRVLAAIEGCRSAAGVFQNALHDLRAYALEADLRVKDGTLPDAKTPDALKASFLEQKKRDLLDDLDRLTTTSAQ